MRSIEQQVRDICLALPGATEKVSHGSPAFFAGKQFVMLWTQGHHDNNFPHLWCAAADGVQAELILSSDRFFRPPYVGHRGWVGMRLDAGGTSVYLHPADASLAAKPGTNTSDRPTYLYLRYPASWMFVAHAIRAQVQKPDPMPASTPLVDGAEVDVPGRPKVTHVPGHTDGSCVLEFPEHGVAFLGDLLCTVSPVTWRPADPQLQTRGSNKSSDVAMQSLERLAGIEAATVLPGHGDPWRDGVEAAVASARRIGCR